MNFVVVPALQLEFAPWKAWGEIDEAQRVKQKFIHNGHEWLILLIGHHYVAVFNPHTTGIGAAAQAAEAAKGLFPKALCVFMTGIAGAVSEELPDARLGDIVWATSVIQHDWGKYTGSNVHIARQDKQFRPPCDIAVKHIGDAKILFFGEQKGLALTLFGKPLPSPSVDLRFPVRVICPQFTADPDEPQPCQCQQNSPGAEIRGRPVDEVKVWDGICASGNQVVKSGQFREKLAELKASHCEMELAGIAQSTEWFGVRSLCDYSDSHKRKEFQQWCGANATAFTICLILSIPQMLSDEKNAQTQQKKHAVAQTIIGNNNNQAHGNGQFAQGSSNVFQLKGK